MKSAVIIGRFQTDEQHEGYKKTFKLIEDEGYDKLILFLGESVTRLTKTNPLPFFVRKRLIEEEYKLQGHKFKLIILKQNDHQSDIIWSQNLDQILDSFSLINFNFIVGRDSFKNRYHGKYKNNFKEVNLSLDTVSSSERRKFLYDNIEEELSKLSINELKAFSKGIIFSSQYQYPRTHSTVDILLYDANFKYILLGRKPGEDFWRMPGGFFDTTDQDDIESALRELHEECNITKEDISKTSILSTHKVEDWRYRGTGEVIKTVLVGMVLKYDSLKKVKAGDDLEEVKWFKINGLDLGVIGEIHRGIVLSALSKQF